MALGLKAAGVAALALTLWTLRWAILRRKDDSGVEGEQGEDVQQALLQNSETQAARSQVPGASEAPESHDPARAPELSPHRPAAAGSSKSDAGLPEQNRSALPDQQTSGDRLPVGQEIASHSDPQHQHQPEETGQGSAQQSSPSADLEHSESKDTISMPAQHSQAEAKLHSDDQDIKQLSPKRTPRVQTQQSSSPSISVQRAQPPLPSPFAEDEHAWNSLSPNSLTPTHSLIKSSQSGSDWTPPQPPSPVTVPTSSSATQSILGAVSLPAKYAYRPSSEEQSEAGSETIDGIPEDDLEDSDSDLEVPPTPSMAARAAAQHIFGGSPRAERLPSFPELDYEESEASEAQDPQDSLLLQHSLQQQHSQLEPQSPPQPAPSHPAGSDAAGPATPAQQVQWADLQHQGSLQAPQTVFHAHAGIPRGPSFSQHLGSRSAQPRRSGPLQPAPTEDPASRLDEAVRQLVTERNSMGIRSRSESDLSKRSSQDRASGQGSGGLELDPEQEDSIRTDDLLERIQDSGRFSRHSIAGSEPSSAELPNGQLAPQASWALRRRSADQSASSLKRAREAVQSQPLALRLDVLAGPTMDQAGFQSQVGVSEVSIGRLESNTLTIADTEVSSQHVTIRWDSNSHHWQVVDLGSLNGSMLNDRIISTSNRREGRAVRLSSDDILQLGSRTKLKVTCLPHQLSQAGPPVLPKRLSTHRRPLHASPTLRSETVTRMAHQAAANPTQSFAVPALHLEAASVVRTGRRSRNKMQVCEDVVLCQRTLPGVAGQAALFCVFDGHNGRSAADEAAHLLPKTLTQHLQGRDADLLEGRGLGKAWEQVFAETDAAIQSDDGCTATAVLVWRAASGKLCLQVANVGDSSAVLAELSPDGELKQPGRYLTADHRLSNLEERDRLKGLGIMLGHGGTRLYGLNLGRCLGDRYLKVEDLGLSAVPHVSPVESFDPSRQMLVLVASDGVWDVASAERVVQAAVTAEVGNAENAAKAVAMHAQKQHTRDDVSVIALVFKQATHTNDG